MILVPTSDLPGRRWCTTTNRGGEGDRHNHGSLSEARQRARDIAALAFDIDQIDRVTVWFNDGDGTGWHTYTTIDIRADLRGVA